MQHIIPEYHFYSTPISYIVPREYLMMTPFIHYKVRQPRHRGQGGSRRRHSQSTVAFYDAGAEKNHKEDSTAPCPGALPLLPPGPPMKQEEGSANHKNHFQMIIYSPTIMSAHLHRRILSYENIDDLRSKLNTIFLQSGREDSKNDDDDDELSLTSRQVQRPQGGVQ
jgi:hypothetical protein